jgi:glyoxylase-like metal-dependent hydrolase (beta-lactamase superfamily II)
MWVYMCKLFLRKTALPFTAAAIMFMLTILSGCSITKEKSTSKSAPEIVKKEGWTEVGKDIYVFIGEFYLVNMVLVTSGKEAVLIDAGMYSRESERVEAFLKERGIELKDIIITHMHGDHTANISAFKTKEMEPITPENAKDNQTVKLGNKTLRIIFTEGHYRPKRHISVEVVDENVLIAGDVICNNIIPPIAAGGDINALLNTLKELQDKNYSAIIPGHGDVVDNDLIFERQFEYLNNAKNRVEKLISSGGKMSDLNSIKLTDCIKDTSYLYKEKLDYWHEQSLEVIYQQLSK